MSPSLDISPNGGDDAPCIFKLNTVMQSCSHAVIQSCSHAVIQSCSHAVATIHDTRLKGCAVYLPWYNHSTQ